MPVWGDKPEAALDDALSKVLLDLEDEVADNPTFAAVTGVPLEKMIAHSTDAISTIFKNKYQKMDLEDLIQCYAMGFVVGLKYSKYQQEAASE